MTEKICSGISAVFGEGICSNVYVLENGKEVLLIDSGDGTTLPEIDEMLMEKKIVNVLLTHGHADHINGMNYISADALLHKADRGILQQLNKYFPDFKVPGNIEELGPGPVAFGKFSLKIIHTPGHTPGSVSFLEERTGTLFSGDTLFAAGDRGRTDLFGGNEEQLQASLELLKKLKYKLLCPGHGPIE